MGGRCGRPRVVEHMCFEARADVWTAWAFMRSAWAACTVLRPCCGVLACAGRSPDALRWHGGSPHSMHSAALAAPTAPVSQALPAPLWPAVRLTPLTCRLGHLRWGDQLRGCFEHRYQLRRVRQSVRRQYEVREWGMRMRLRCASLLLFMRAAVVCGYALVHTGGQRANFQPLVHGSCESSRSA